MSEPLINILIRTSNRPEEFKQCIDSIRAQTYKNIRLIVCTDKPEESMPYINANLYDFGATIFTVESTGIPFHWNFYCNNLKERVAEGWFFYLDDDDTIRDNDGLEKIAFFLGASEELQPMAIICQFQRGNKLKPFPRYTAHGTLWLSEIVRGKIGGSCIFLHHSQKNVANWDGQRAADYRFIKAVAEKIPLEFVPVVVVKAGNNGRHGK